MQYRFTARQRLAFYLTKNNIFDSWKIRTIYLQSFHHPHPEDPLEKKAAEIKDELDAEMTSIAESGIKMVFLGEPGFPEALSRIEDSPLMLFVKSKTDVHEILSRIDRKLVAVIGTRDADSYGTRMTKAVVTGLRNSVVVSGLAIGIDIEALKQALQDGIPAIAVLPCGLNRIYPAANSLVAQTIADTEGCALISPFAPGTPPIPASFLVRNRVMAALSDTVIVVESKVKGGSIVAARLAFDYGRTVYAVPGRLGDVRSEGCNLLIHAGFAELFLPSDIEF